MSVYFHSGLDFTKSGNSIADLARPSDNVTPNTIQAARDNLRDCGTAGRRHSGVLEGFGQPVRELVISRYGHMRRPATRSSLHVCDAYEGHMWANVLVKSYTYIMYQYLFCSQVLLKIYTTLR